MLPEPRSFTVVDDTATTSYSFAPIPIIVGVTAVHFPKSPLFCRNGITRQSRAVHTIAEPRLPNLLGLATRAKPPKTES